MTSEQYHINHRVAYKELDGIDKTIQVTRKEHSQEHKQPRINGRFIENPNKKGVVAKRAASRLNSKKIIRFDTGLKPHTRLREEIRYSPMYGTVHYSWRMEGFWKHAK